MSEYDNDRLIYKIAHVIEVSLESENNYLQCAEDILKEFKESGLIIVPYNPPPARRERADD